MSLTNAWVDGYIETPFTLADALAVQDAAGAGNFGAAYGKALAAPVTTTAFELSQIDRDVDVYGELQGDFEDMANALRSHANDQVFTVTDRYRKVLDKAYAEYDTKTKEAEQSELGTESTAEQDKWSKSRGQLEKVRNILDKGEKLSQSDAAGASALIAEAKGWVIPSSKTRDVTSSKVKFLNEEYQQGLTSIATSVRNQFNR